MSIEHAEMWYMFLTKIPPPGKQHSSSNNHNHYRYSKKNNNSSTATKMSANLLKESQKTLSHSIERKININSSRKLTLLTLGGHMRGHMGTLR